jgi:hypothetical protein
MEWLVELGAWDLKIRLACRTRRLDAVVGSTRQQRCNLNLYGASVW